MARTKQDSHIWSTIVNGTCIGSSRTYLMSAGERNNLYVTFKSTMTKILIDSIYKSGNQCGVRQVWSNYGYVANKELILSAGAIISIVDVIRASETSYGTGHKRRSKCTYRWKLYGSSHYRFNSWTVNSPILHIPEI